jgi:dTDP-4-amino-4,6-dideoxygalactose transaminase
MHDNLAHRRNLWNDYCEKLAPLEKAGKLRILKPPEHIVHNAHMLAILLPSPAEADRLRIGLDEAGIQAVIHYVPLHTSGMGERLGYTPSDLPITVESAGSLLRLPFYHELTETSISYISEALSSMF